MTAIHADCTDKKSELEHTLLCLNLVHGLNPLAGKWRDLMMTHTSITPIHARGAKN